MLINKIIIFGLLVILANTVNGQQKCRTPSGSIGRCIPFQSCDPLYSLVTRGQQLSQSEYDLIMKSLCDPLDGVQIICCLASMKSSIPVTSNLSQSSNDLTQHSNARLVSIRNCGKVSGYKISFGTLTEPFEFPWMAMLQVIENNQLTFKCGGSLISRRFVLTAAHCITTIQGPIPINSVVLGEHNTATERDCIHNECAEPIQIIPVEKQIPHPNFVVATAQNDIGLLRLQYAARFSDSVMPVCLPYTSQTQTADDALLNIFLTGWGLTENYTTSSILLKTTLNVTPLSECASIYKQNRLRATIDLTRLCAFDAQSGSCTGDSGGPAVFSEETDAFGPRMFQFGIVSTGTQTCGRNNDIPGVYTRVTAYMQWILDNISE